MAVEMQAAEPAGQPMAVEPPVAEPVAQPNLVLGWDVTEATEGAAIKSLPAECGDAAAKLVNLANHSDQWAADGTLRVSDAELKEHMQAQNEHGPAIDSDATDDLIAALQVASVLDATADPTKGEIHIFRRKPYVPA